MPFMEKFDIQKSDKQEEPKNEEVLRFESTKELPKSVLEYFDKVPDRIKKRLFPEEAPAGHEGEERSVIERFEDVVATMTEREREDFAKKCFFELFYEAELTEVFKYTNRGSLTEEVSRFVEVLWTNRGKRGGEIKLFNEDYYEKFFAEQESKENEIKEREKELERARIANDKRKTDSRDSKIWEKYAALRSEVDRLKKELENFNNKNDNADFFRVVGKGVEGRKNRENKWTEALAVLEEYLDPAEFATLIAEQFDSVFSLESMLARKKAGDKYFGHELSEEVVENAKREMKKIRDAIENWAAKHAEDEALKKPTDVKAEEKILKLVEYFHKLFESYSYHKKQGRKDEDLNAEVRLMENTLNLLSKK